MSAQSLEPEFSDTSLSFLDEGEPAVIARPDLGNTDLGDVPPEWLDPETIGLAGRAQAAADAGLAVADTDGDGVTDAGEFMDDTDPLDPTDARSKGWTEDFDPALGGIPDINQGAILD